jgi:endonuclease V-like protein UPF0215 family
MMVNSDKGTKSYVTTVRLNETENRDLEQLVQFFGSTKSDVLADGMRMIRDFKQIIEGLVHDEPELAKVLRASLTPGIFNIVFHRDMMGRVGERVIVGLIKKDLEGDGKRVKLILKLLQK